MNGQFEESARIGQMLLRLFEYWELSSNQQLSLLGLPGEKGVSLGEYLRGRPLSRDRDKLERASILLGIHKSLRLLFPQNRDLAYRWISQPNAGFDGLTPFDVMERHGMLGMYMVRGYLDRQCVGEDLTLEALIEAIPKISLGRGEAEVEWLSVASTGKESPDFVLENGTEGILKLFEVWSTAVRVFASEDKARRWIESNVPALGCAPVALLATSNGRKKVLAAIGRIEQGDTGG